MSRLDDVLVDIQRRVEQRRAAGDYPPDLEQRLAAHVARHRDGEDPGVLRGALDALGVSRHFDPDRIPTTSRSRAGAAAHRALQAALARQTSGIFAQVGEFAEQVEVALRLIAQRLDAGPSVLLAAQLDAVLDRLTRIEGAPPAPAPRISEAGVVPSSGEWWNAQRWVDTLDGPFEEVVALRAALAAGLEGPVLDVSCRRGELLWALREQGIEATGVDADARLAATAAAAGLAVGHAGPIVTLARAEEGSLGAVAALGVAGRLGAQGAADLVALAADKLRFGGRLVVELADAEGPGAFADPLAGPPIPAQWIRFACDEARLRTVEVQRAAEAPAGTRPGCFLVTAVK